MSRAFWFSFTVLPKLVYDVNCQIQKILQIFHHKNDKAFQTYITLNPMLICIQICLMVSTLPCKHWIKIQRFRISNYSP